MIQRTFSIIKPDAVADNKTGEINAIIENNDLKIIAQKRIKMTIEQAKKFYGVHKERPFFLELVEFITSGPIVVQVLEGDDAVLKYRHIMGATDPKQAAEGTIRKLYGKSIGENAVHGSDCVDNAKIEITQFFSENEIISI